MDGLHAVEAATGVTISRGDLLFDARSRSSMADPGPPHTGFGDCGCFECWPPEPDYPLADHGGDSRDWHLWFVCFSCWFGGVLLGVLIGVWAS